MEIRRLTAKDAQPLWDLRLESLQSEPRSFGESWREHKNLPIAVLEQRLSAHENFIFGALDASAGLIVCRGRLPGASTLTFFSSRLKY